MLKKTIFIPFGLTLWLFGIPTIYPIEPATQPRGNVVQLIENIKKPMCAVHPMGEEYDLNLDGVVDDVDILNVANAWNSKLLEQKYNQAYDFNKDNKIDIYDIMIIASKWGKSCHELYPKGKNR